MQPDRGIVYNGGQFGGGLGYVAGRKVRVSRRCLRLARVVRDLRTRCVWFRRRWLRGLTVTASNRLVEVARAARGVMLTSDPFSRWGRLTMRWEAKDGSATGRRPEGGDCRYGLRLSARFVRRLRGASATHVRFLIFSYRRFCGATPRCQAIETITESTRGRTPRPRDHEGRSVLGRSYSCEESIQ